jgi:hypothetical protein
MKDNAEVLDVMFTDGRLEMLSSVRDKTFIRSTEAPDTNIIRSKELRKRIGFGEDILKSS